MTRRSISADTRDLHDDDCPPAWHNALIVQQNTLWDMVRHAGGQPRSHLSPHATYVVGDVIQWLAELPSHSFAWCRHCGAGDRPKGAEDEFPQVSMMARSCWEPWGIFRKPFPGTAAENLRRWGTGGLRRIAEDEPFKDVIACSPTRGRKREITPHPSLKPQRFMRQIVRAALPLGLGVLYDPFADSGSTLAAATAVGYLAIGTDRDETYHTLAQAAFGPLAALEVSES